jgi:hypothetical protein
MCWACVLHAGLLKVLLTFEHGLLPANLHFKEPNPNNKSLQDGVIKARRPAPLFQCVTAAFRCCAGHVCFSVHAQHTNTSRHAEHGEVCLAQVVTELTPWEGGIVALSNFGFGGEAPVQPSHSKNLYVHVRPQASISEEAGCSMHWVLCLLQERMCIYWWRGQQSLCWQQLQQLWALTARTATLQLSATAR